MGKLFISEGLPSVENLLQKLGIKHRLKFSYISFSFREVEVALFYFGRSLSGIRDRVCYAVAVEGCQVAEITIWTSAVCISPTTDVV